MPGRHGRALRAGVVFSAALTNAAAAATATILVPGAPLHGVNGLAFGPDGMLYAASFVGRTVHKVDPHDGRVETLIAAPFGDADDVAVRADGVIVWTAASGELRGKWPGQVPRVVADQLPSINPVAWAADGDVAVGQIGEPDAVWLIDVDAPAHRRKVLSDAGHLNGFAFGPDGTLYAPLWQRDGIVAIDMQRGTEKLVATGVGMPAAVKVDRNGQLVSVDWLHGEIHRTDPKSGQTQILAIATPPLDNLALGPDGTVYVSNPADSTIQALAPDAQTMRDVVRGHFSAIAGLTMTTVNGREMLLVADPLAYRLVDPRTGEVIRPAYVQDIPMSTDIAANDRAVVTSHQSRGLVRMIARENGGIMGASIAEYKVPSATGVALLANGDIIAADFDDGQLVRLRDARTEIVARGLRGPMNLLPLSANEVLVSEATGGVVSKIDLRSGARTVIARDLDKPQGLALLPRGRLAIAEKGRGRVIAVSLKGSSKTEILADNLPVTADIFRALPDVGLPMGLAADRSGNIYVACVGDNSIRKIAAQR